MNESQIRRKKYIDSKIQLDIIFPIVGVQFILYTFVIAIIVFNVTHKNENSNFGKNQVKVLEVKNNNTENLNKNSQYGDSRFFTGSKKLIKNQQQNTTSVNAHVLNINNMNFNWIIVLICVGMLQLFILFYYILKKTRRVSEPEFVMVQNLQDIINGKRPDLSKNSKNDYLQELYEKLKIVYDKKRNE